MPYGSEAYTELPLDQVPMMTVRELLHYHLALRTTCGCRIVDHWLRLVIDRTPFVADWPVRRVAEGMRCEKCGTRPRLVSLRNPLDHAPLVPTRPPDWEVVLVGSQNLGGPE